MLWEVNKVCWVSLLGRLKGKSIASSLIFTVINNFRLFNFPPNESDNHNGRKLNSHAINLQGIFFCNIVINFSWKWLENEVTRIVAMGYMLYIIAYCHRSDRSHFHHLFSPGLHIHIKTVTCSVRSCCRIRLALFY